MTLLPWLWEELGAVQNGMWLMHVAIAISNTYDNDYTCTSSAIYMYCYNYINIIACVTLPCSMCWLFQRQMLQKGSWKVCVQEASVG